MNIPTIYILNPTGLAKNNAVQLLATDVASCNADIIAVTKTWFKSQHNNSYSNIDGFTCFRLDRCKRSGGGVCTYIKNKLNAEQLHFV